MKLTSAAANLLVEAADRHDRYTRMAFLSDVRVATSGDKAAFDKLVAMLKKN